MATVNGYTMKHDSGAVLKDVYACGSQTAAGAAICTVAGATEDGTKVTGATIDRKGYGSLKLRTTFVATLTNTKTASFTVEEQQSSDGSTWDTATTVQAATVVATGTATVANFYDVQDHGDIDLGAKKRYVRYNVTPALSATSADDLIWTTSVSLGGPDKVPAA